MTPLQLVRGLGELGRFVRLHGRSSLLQPVPGPGAGKAASPAGGKAPGIVVSLSTLPSRIGHIFPALNSLLDQTVLPDRIFLAIPPFSQRERKGYDIPEGLKNHPLVTILPAERDWGPATKLIPALRHFAVSPDQAILAVDDDNVYPRTLIATFLRHSQAMPGAALSLRGWPIPASHRWRDSRAFKGTALTRPQRTDVITGCGGILVRPRFFDHACFAYEEAPPEAFFVDDIWTSGHLARCRVPKYVLPFSGAFVYLPSLATRSGAGLDQAENRSGKNNDVLIDYFRAYWGWPADPGAAGQAGATGAGGFKEAP